MTFAEVEGIERALEAARKRDADARAAKLEAAQDELLERARKVVIERMSRHSGISAEQLGKVLRVERGSFGQYSDGTPILHRATVELFVDSGYPYEMIEVTAYIANDGGLERFGQYTVPSGSREQGFDTFGAALMYAADQYAVRVKVEAEWVMNEERIEAEYQERLAAREQEREKEKQENEELLAVIKGDPVAMSLLRAFVAVCEGRDVIEVQ